MKSAIARTVCIGMLAPMNLLATCTRLLSALVYTACPGFLATSLKRTASAGWSSDDFLGDRFWGQVQGFSGKLKALQGRGRRAEQPAVLEGDSRVAGKAR
jgi:hypothetical protein